MIIYPAALIWYTNRPEAKKVVLLPLYKQAGMRFQHYPLLPFAYLYAGIMRTRNWLYDKGIFKSREFPVTVINIGNLTVGGTGKTPHVEYLVHLLKTKEVAILSRGYKRITTGFVLAGNQDTAETIGDEPYQYFRKFEQVSVAVCENRVTGINKLLQLKPQTQVILLDDAFQHRPVKAQLNILLTDYNRLFFQDYVLPAGRLRESRVGAQRADAVVVSKCPDNLPEQEASRLTQLIKVYTKPAIPVFFSVYRYQAPVAIGKQVSCLKKIILITGIAQPASLLQYLNSASYQIVKHFNFPDHYAYTQQDITEISNFAGLIAGISLLTTEKDGVKLAAPEFRQQIQNLPLFYLPIEVSFLTNQNKFNQLVLKTVVHNTKLNNYPNA